MFFGDESPGRAKMVDFRIGEEACRVHGSVPTRLGSVPKGKGTVPVEVCRSGTCVTYCDTVARLDGGVFVGKLSWHEDC